MKSTPGGGRGDMTYQMSNEERSWRRQGVHDLPDE